MLVDNAKVLSSTGLWKVSLFKILLDRYLKNTDCRYVSNCRDSKIWTDILKIRIVIRCSLQLAGEDSTR